MREIFALTTKALTQQDYVALARLAAYRRQFVDDAQPGSSPMIDAWKADHQAVRKANQLVHQPRYSEAVALLQQPPQAPTAYADAARDYGEGFNRIQDDVVSTLGDRMPARDFREAIAPLEYTLGAGRQPAVREYDGWTTLLRRPSFYLYDGAGGCYAMAGGMLW